MGVEPFNISASLLGVLAQRLVRKVCSECRVAYTPDPDRADAVRRAYLGGEAYAELSDRYAVPLNTIRTWLRRSLLKLRECLGS